MDKNKKKYIKYIKLKKPKTPKIPKEKWVIIDDIKYDVSSFNHPGDGICNLYLYEFYEKDISEEFDHYHYTDKPWKILETMTILK